MTLYYVVLRYVTQRDIAWRSASSGYAECRSRDVWWRCCVIGWRRITSCEIVVVTWRRDAVSWTADRLRVIRPRKTVVVIGGDKSVTFDTNSRSIFSIPFSLQSPLLVTVVDGSRWLFGDKNRDLQTEQSRWRDGFSRQNRDLRYSCSMSNRVSVTAISWGVRSEVNRWPWHWVKVNWLVLRKRRLL